MKIKTCKATPLQLNYLVAKCKGMTIEIRPARACGRPLYVLAAEAGSTPWTWEPSTSWRHGGPIIEREGISTIKYKAGGHWSARTMDYPPKYITGQTPLIAAMRCYVASELGDEVEMPEELCAN